MKVIKISIFFFAVIFLFHSTVFAHSWMAPKEASSIENPVALSLESKNSGKKLFMMNCSGCHGKDARGSDKKKAGFSMNSPDLIKRIKNHSDGDFFWKIQTGRGDMPSFKDDFSDKNIWDIINFIKSLPDK